MCFYRDGSLSRRRDTLDAARRYLEVVLDDLQRGELRPVALTGAVLTRRECRCCLSRIGSASSSPGFFSVRRMDTPRVEKSWEHRGTQREHGKERTE